MEVNMSDKDKDKEYESALTDFLKLFEFTDEEIKEQWPRLIKTFDIWEINKAEDFKAATERAHYIYDLSLKG
jgi:hypothetical protein